MMKCVFPQMTQQFPLGTPFFPGCCAIYFSGLHYILPLCIASDVGMRSIMEISAIHIGICLYPRFVFLDVCVCVCGVLI